MFPFPLSLPSFPFSYMQFVSLSHSILFSSFLSLIREQSRNHVSCVAGCESAGPVRKHNTNVPAQPKSFAQSEIIKINQKIYNKKQEHEQQQPNKVKEKGCFVCFYFYFSFTAEPKKKKKKNWFHY